MKKSVKIVLIILLIFFVIVLGNRIWRCSQKEGRDMSQYQNIAMLKVPTVEEVSDNPYVYRYNHELAKEKDLIDRDRLSDYYLCLQAIYRANLDAYLLEELDIKKLDEKLKDSHLGFVSHKPEDKDLYEKESTMGLKFIYLRNSLYIEYLNEEYLEMLERQLKEGKGIVTSELKAMVKETYPEVIKVRDSENWKEQRSFLYSGIQGRKPEIPNQALVLEIANAWEYDLSGNLLSENNMREKCSYLDKVKIEKEREYSEILGTEVYIFLE